MKGLKKTLVKIVHVSHLERVSDHPSALQLSRSKSTESSSSKTKEAKAAAAAAAAPPPPPPNSTKPLPQPAVANHGHPTTNIANHAAPAVNGSSNSSRPVSLNPAGSSVPPRGYAAPDRAAPAPPIVVVSPEAAPEPATIERHSLDGSVTPPRANTLTRLRTGPKDTIPIVGKPPRKQRSSRFVITEKVEIEKLPPFMGTQRSTRQPLARLTASIFFQRHRPPSDPSFSSRSYISVQCCSTSTTPTPS